MLKMREEHYIFFFCLFTAMVPVLAVDMPRGLAFAPGIIGIIFYALYRPVFNVPPDFSWKTFWFALIAFGISASSLLWAQYFDVSAKQVLKLAFLLPPQILLISLAVSLHREQLKPYIHFFPHGVAVAAVLLCFEILSGGIMHNFIRGNAFDIAADPDSFNRGAVTLSLYSFSALALMKSQKKPFLCSFLILTLLALALFTTESQSAQLSFLVGLGFLFLFPYHSKIAWQGLIFLTLILMATAPVFMSLIYYYYSEAIQNFPMMAQAFAGHRLEIWDYVSRYALQESLHGYGIEATRAITDFDSKQVFMPNNVTLHPHNFALQIWIEFGIIGVIIGMGLVYALFSTIQNHFTVMQQKIILPTLMAAIVPAAVAYGMWQGWWLGLLFHLTAICLIVCKFADDAEADHAAAGNNSHASPVSPLK